MLWYSRVKCSKKQDMVGGLFWGGAKPTLKEARLMRRTRKNTPCFLFIG